MAENFETTRSNDDGDENNRSKCVGASKRRSRAQTAAVRAADGAR